jgi:uncharacterized protein YjbI with pentapeptide repeats
MPSSKLPIEPADPAVLDDPVTRELPEDLVDHELEACLLEGVDLSSRDARGLRLIESQLVEVDLTGSVLVRARMRDVVWRDGSLANLRAEGADVRRVRFERVRATGADFTTCHLEDVTFIDSRMDLANFRFAQLDRVRFERCRMNEADFYEAKLISVVFDDCDLTRASWSAATFERSEMRGCDLAGASDPERLRGVRMPWPDVIRSAREIAGAAGIGIIE